MIKLHASKDVAEALAWCKLNVVEYNKDAHNLYDKRGWAYERFTNSTNFVFLREQDAFMFSLRFA